MAEVHVEPSGRGWVQLGYDLTRSPDEWSVWFAVAAVRRVLVVVTVRADGEVAGFEVHSGDERQTPLDRGDDVPKPEAPWPWVLRPLVPSEPVGLTAQMLRLIPFGELAAAARSTFGVLLGWTDEGFAAFDRQLELLGDDNPISAARLARERSLRPGRRGRPDRYYAALALAYELWLGSGKPLRVLADEVYLSVPGLRTALKTARDRGLLTEAPKGRKGGRATDRAKQLLEEGDDDGIR